MKYIPQTMVTVPHTEAATVPNTETVETPYLGTLDELVAGPGHKTLTPVLDPSEIRNLNQHEMMTLADLHLQRT